MLGKREVDRATPRDKEYQICDGEIPGLWLRVYPSGKKVYALQYRNETGRKRTLTLGTHGSKLTPQEARGLAKEKLAAIAHGADPAAERRMLRKAGDLESLVATYRKCRRPLYFVTVP